MIGGKGGDLLEDFPQDIDDDKKSIVNNSTKINIDERVRTETTLLNPINFMILDFFFSCSSQLPSQSI